MISLVLIRCRDCVIPWQHISKQDRQYKYNVTLRRVHHTAVAVNENITYFCV